VIGQTPLSVLNIRREPLVPYKPGDILRFRQIRSEDFNGFVGMELEPRCALEPLVSEPLP
jgi:allophanate hydrolase subunit 1